MQGIGGAKKGKKALAVGYDTTTQLLRKELSLLGEPLGVIALEGLAFAALELKDPCTTARTTASARHGSAGERARAACGRGHVA